MPSVDLRTRRDDKIEPVDASEFFDEQLPRLLAERRHLAEPGARELAPRPMAIEVGGVSWTLALAVDDSDVEKAQFLAEAGFVHIANVFSAEEMTAVSAEIDAAVAEYAPDDGRSWWARTSSGEHRAVRLEYFHEHSPTTQALLAD